MESLAYYMAEPMIQIKKPDGTFVKVSLSEFKKQQASKKQTAPVSVAPSVLAPGQIMAKTTVEIVEKKSAAPVTQKIDREGARSLLEEKTLVKNSAGLTSQKREGQVDEIVRTLGFAVAADLQGRLKSLVLARLKDIKSEEDVREILIKPVKNGGIGLSENQAEKVVRSCKSAMGDESQKQLPAAETPVLKGKKPTMSLMVEPPELPMVIPVNDGVKIKHTTPHTIPGAHEKEKIVTRLIHESIANEPVFKISSHPAVKQTMHDILTPEAGMGPIEELRSTTLEDFRRLSTSPDEAAKRLLQKMINLKDESFVWYLDGIAAFHNSPLYGEYISAVCHSLAERKTVASVLTEQNSIKLSEMVALVEMEAAL